MKAGGHHTAQWLTKVFQADAIRLEERNYPPVYKGKGQSFTACRACKNYRGITLLSTPGKAFTLTLLARVKTKPLEARRPEQSGFTPHRSTVDRIITLNTLLQTCREFNKPLWIAYVDLKSAFDSVDRESLWLLLRRHSIPDKLVELMKELYTGTCSCVLADGMRSEWFLVLSGVRQGCTVAPDLFLNPMDWILNRTVEQTPHQQRIFLRSGLHGRCYPACGNAGDSGGRTAGTTG